MTDQAMTEAPENEVVQPRLHVAPSPHLAGAMTTRSMMTDVLIGLAPATVMAVVYFQVNAVLQIGVCVVSCLAAEFIFTSMRGRAMTLKDCSAIVTGLILGLSLPWSAPIYVGVVGSFVAIGLSKVIFGGLGQNIFNPAMVGRAFVMISFSGVMGGAAYQMASHESLELVTQATPLSAAVKDIPGLWPLFVGNVNGSLGETSALACVIGGLWLLVRRSASWQLPVGSILGLVAMAGLGQMLGGELTILQHLCGGAFLFAAFFIATDPVTTPVAPVGKWIFGIGFGALVYVIRTFAAYPEGVLFAILLMNSMTPLINRWSIPTPLGGPVPERK